MRIATFVCDVTPPAGTPLGMGGTVPPAIGVLHRLSCRGAALWDSGGGGPVVVCALDWIGISNGGYAAWRVGLAEAASTVPERVAVHALHPHDAPGADPDAEALMVARGLPGQSHDAEFVDGSLARAQVAVRAAIAHPVPVTHVGVGAARVVRVASNRRVLGPDGMVAHVRLSSTPDPKVRAAPEGIVDPWARVVSLWNEDTLVAVLSYYATHPQSYYRQRLVSYDFVGMAREQIQQTNPRAVHIHFCGAAGNITAGKYNDGAPANRAILAGRLADGLRTALEFSTQNRTRVSDADPGWSHLPVALPLAPHLANGQAEAAFERDPVFRAARGLAWANRCQVGETIDISCLRLGPAHVLHLPGEAFIEYQLAAQTLRPDLFLAVAAYGDYGPGYIGTTLAYSQGGYETGPASRVAPDAENTLFPAIQTLVEAPPSNHETPSDITARAPRLRPAT